MDRFPEPDYVSDVWEDNLTDQQMDAITDLASADLGVRLARNLLIVTSVKGHDGLLHDALEETRESMLEDIFPEEDRERGREFYRDIYYQVAAGYMTKTRQGFTGGHGRNFSSESEVHSYLAQLEKVLLGDYHGRG